MKIRLISDIHCEFDSDNGEYFLESFPNEDIDVLIIAGDLATGKSIFTNALRKLCDKFPNVVYVMGNHEYWGSSIADRISELEELDDEIDNLHFLENRSITIDGQKFVGCTMWFKEDPVHTSGTWIDFRATEGGCHDIFEQNDKSVEFLNNNVTEDSIVITHHLPTWGCVDKQWQGESTNCYFVCDVEDIILKHNPKIWCHGHSHSAIDFMADKTRIIRNPRAYPHEVSYFNENHNIDV